MKPRPIFFAENLGPRPFIGKIVLQPNPASLVGVQKYALSLTTQPNCVI
jgi:hypothetical protein